MLCCSCPRLGTAVHAAMQSNDAGGGVGGHKGQEKEHRESKWCYAVAAWGWGRQSLLKNNNA